MGKKGAMKLSFGLIFSIVLIIFFIAFAFYVIPKFLDFQDKIKVGKFVDEFGADVERMWRGNQGSQELEYILPDKIKEVCFDEDARVFFKPFGVGGDFDYAEIEHLDIDSFCLDVVDGKVNIVIKKDFDEILVSILNGP